MNRTNVILLALYEADLTGHGLSQRQLAETAGVSQANQSPVLITLIEHGLVTRRKDYPTNSHDVKVNVYYLTPEGRQMAEVMSKNRGFYVRRG